VDRTPSPRRGARAVGGEASTWLGTSAGGATLAELYALRDADAEAVEREPVLEGQYP
jgi:hypothetical protein